MVQAVQQQESWRNLRDEEIFKSEEGNIILTKKQNKNRTKSNFLMK